MTAGTSWLGAESGTSRSRNSRRRRGAGGLKSEHASDSSDPRRLANGMTMAIPRRPGWELFGRDRERAELVAGLEDALVGQGRLFLIAGEPGIGKTRLAEQLASHAAERGARVVWGRCWEGGGAPPYWPWAQIVRAVAEGCDDETLRVVARERGGVRRRSWRRTWRCASGRRTGRPCRRSSPTRRGSSCSRRRPASSSGPPPSSRPCWSSKTCTRPTIRRCCCCATWRATCATRACWWSGRTATSRSGARRASASALGELVRDGQLMTLRGLARDDVKGLIGDLVGAAPSDATV